MTTQTLTTKKLANAGRGRYCRSNSMAVCFAIAVLFGAINARAQSFTFAGFTWDQTNTPDVLSLLGNGDNLGGATFSSGTATRITGSVGFIATSGNSGSGFVPAPGYDSDLSLGKQANAQQGLTQGDGTGSVFTSAVNLPNGNNGTTTRHGLSVSWSGGFALPNGSGTDFVLYESGSNATSPEGQMVRVRLASTGVFSDWHYRAVDAFEVYVNTPNPTSTGAFATAFDLSDLGIGSGELIDVIQIANLMPDDRILESGAFAAAGFVVFNDPSGPLPKPSVGSLPGLDPNSTFDSGELDPDPLYVAVQQTVVLPPTARGKKEDAIDALEIHLPSGDDFVDKQFEKAIDKIEKSLDIEFWIDDVRVNDKKVFDEEKKAVKELEKVIDDDDASAAAKQWAELAILCLVEADRILVQTAIDDATAAAASAGCFDPNPPKDCKKVLDELDRALDDQSDAESEVTAGDFEKAIGKFKKAWERAQKTIDKAGV